MLCCCFILFHFLQTQQPQQPESKFKNEQDVYIELDLDEVIQKKIDIIMKHGHLRQLTGFQSDEM
jgi:hypothetical protein